MNKIITGACIIVVYCLSACADSEPDQDSSLMNTDKSIPATITPGSQNLVKPDTTLPVKSPVVINPLPQPVVNQVSSTTTAPGINPPHGQANHRCDIAVGAPLNSPATKPPTQTVAPTITPVQNTTVKTTTPAGMNPKHGEPGHRCDIAVGAPLNSPVTKPATQTVTSIPGAAPVILPAKKDSGGK